MQDGFKLLMVAYEMLVVRCTLCGCVQRCPSLYALLFAFPHIPDRNRASFAIFWAHQQRTRVHVIKDPNETPHWFQVNSVPAMQAAIENMLQNSNILEISLARGKGLPDIRFQDMGSPAAVSKLFALRLEEDDCPTAVLLPRFGVVRGRPASKCSKTSARCIRWSKK